LTEKYTCPCCGYKTHSREDHLWEICEVCYWQSCPVQNSDPDYIGGPNPVSLRQAQQNFLTFGACENDMIKNTRKPGADEPKDEWWKPSESHSNKKLVFNKDWVFTVNHIDGIGSDPDIRKMDTIACGTYKDFLTLEIKNNPPGNFISYQISKEPGLVEYGTADGWNELVSVLQKKIDQIEQNPATLVWPDYIGGKMMSLLKSISKNATDFNPDFFTEEEKTAQWIGRSPATDEAIAGAERKLGVKLPEDVFAMYKITNGTSVILNQTFSGFLPVEEIDWLKNADPALIDCYAEMGEVYVNDLKNSIIIAGLAYPHSVLLIQPFGGYKDWRYWEFASYIPGETPFQGIEKYLERLNDFLADQNKNRDEIFNK
jgi:hypothetical protein